MDADQDHLLIAVQAEGLPTLSPRRPDARTPSLSLILPALNARETIAQAIQEADAALSVVASEYEILVIDDGGTDATFSIASELALQYPAVKVLRQPPNLGYGAAIRRGFASATGTLIAVADAGCQFDLRELDRLLLLAEKYPLVSGYRLDRQTPWPRHLCSAVYNSLARLLLDTRARDCNCALKLVHRAALADFPTEAKGYFFHTELLARASQAGQAVVEVGVTQRARAAGERKASLREVVPALTALLRFWWRNILFPATLEESGARTRGWSKRTERAAGLFLILISCLLLFSRLGYPLIAPDETRYAQIPYEMLQSGDWITPTLEGEPYLDKPPLLYWAIAGSYRLFGVNETAARLPCAVAAFLTVLFTFVLGKRLVGSPSAWCAAVGLLLCGGFVVSGRFLLMDGLLTFFCLVGWLSGYLACRGSRIQLGWWLATATACGLGILVKGPIAVVLIFPPLCAARWFASAKPRISPRHWAMLTGVILTLTTPWFLAVSWADQQFLLPFFWKHHLVRFFHTFHHNQPWWFYLPVLLVAMFPLSLLFPALASFLFGRQTTKLYPRTPEQGFLFLAAGWVLLLFSMSSCKLPPYIFPAFPPLCLLLGTMFTSVVFSSDARAKLADRLSPMPRRIGVLIAGLGMLAAGVDLAFFQEASWNRLIAGAFFAAAAFGLVVFLRAKPNPSPKLWAYSVCFALVLSAFFFQELLPAFSRHRSVHAEIAQRFQRHDQTPVLYYSRRTYSAVFHLESSRIVRFDSKQLNEVGRFLQSHPQVILVTTPESAARIRQRFGDVIRLTAQTGDGTLYLTQTRAWPVARLPVRTE